MGFSGFVENIKKISSWVVLGVGVALFTVGPVQAAPGIPQTLQPADGKLNVAKNPTLEISCNDPLVVAAQFVIATDSIFANLVYDSFETVNDLCSHVALAQLNTQTQYHWRARVKDQLGDWSDWSSSRSFTTNSLSAPFFNVFQDGVANYSGTRDADIRGSFQDPTQAIRNWNQGAQNVLRTGRRRDGSTTDEIYRSLLKFDVSELSNKNAVITAYIEMTGWEHGPKPDNPDFDGANSMFEVIRGWGEGQSLENTPPANGEVSWISSTHPNQWSIPGAAHASNSDSSADRKATPLVKMVVTNQVGYKTIWSSKNLVDLVKSWIEQPNQNDGVLIQADDESIQMNLSLASREHVDPAFRPRLVVVSTEEAFLAQNHPPFAIRDSAETQSNVQISIPVLANDFDQDSSPASLFIDSVTAPENGTTNMVGSEIAYLPDQGFLGVDKFFYTISDGQDTASAVVSVLVTSETPVNQPPIAINDQIGVLFETSVDINVLNNDSDSSGLDESSLSITSNPTNGTTSVDTTIGIITYTPNAGYLGIDSFLYTVADVEGLVSNVATVSVIVAEAGTRVTAGLAVYYPLTTGSGNIVHDQSLVGTPMELTLSGNVAWGPGAQGLVFSGGAAQSSGPATKLIDALQLTNQSTIEIWIQPANTTQTGPTRIVSIGADSSKQNLMMGQKLKNIEMRLLHSSKDNQGKPRLETSDDELTTELLHVVHTYDGSTERVYVNGVENPVTVALSGDFSNWDWNDPLTLGNEGDGTRPWGGTMRMMAAYDRALSLAEVHQNFTSGPPGAGSGGSGNQAPVANNDSASTVQNVPIVVVVPGVLGNDTDGNNDPLTAVLDANPSNGTVSLQTDGSYTYTPNSGFTGPDSFTYHAHDGTLDSNVVTVTITITGSNTAPVATNDTGTTPLNTAVVINVLTNDTDDGVINPASVAVQSSASNGLTSVNGSTGAITYTPNISYVGSDSFSYTVADTLGLTSNVATVTVTVTGSTTLGFTNITSTTNTGGPSTFGGHGVQFADVTGDDRPDFYVTMNLQPTDMAELFYRNNNGTSFPEEANTRGIANFDTGSHGGVWADLDNDGDYDLFNGSYNQNRVYRNNGTGTFADMTSGSGLPTQEWETRGVTAFDMDQDGDLDLFAVTGFQGTNDPSGERNEVYRNDGNFNFTSIQTGTLYTAPAGQGVTDVDYDGDGDIDLWVANRTGDVNILRNNGDGSFTLVNPSTLGITHKADDGITFADFNNDGALDVLLGDFYYLNDGDNTYTFQQQFSAPGYMGGVEDLDNDGDWDVVFAGDNNVFLNNGSGGFTASPTFSIGPVSDPRSVAFADIDADGDMDFFYAQKKTFNMLIRNDLVSGNGWLKVKLTRASGQTGAFGAKVEVYQAGQVGQAAGRITWREARGQEGYLGQNDPTLHFGMGLATLVDIRVVFPGGAIVDQLGVTSGQTVTVVETGGSSNQAPVATGESYSGTQDTPLILPAPGVLTNDSDPNSDPLTAVLDTNTSNGTVVLNADGSVTYTPTGGFSGTDSFTYHAHDGALNSNVVTVTVMINGAPVANADSAMTVEGVAVSIAVLTNDTDDGGLNAASVVVENGPTNGTTSVNSGTGGITYTPNAAYLGTDSFTYTVQDLQGVTSNAATVTVEVTDGNVAPTAVADGYSGTQALQLSIVGPGVLTNDSDLNSDPLTAVLDTNTSHGTVGLNADGSFTYTPTAGFSGTDSFTYHAHDGALDSNVVTVILNINGAPVANNDSTTTVKGVATTIAVLTNDTDDGGLNVASVIVQSGPTNGTTSVNSGSGVITYTPNATYLGTDSFTYTVQDLAGILSNVATVTVTVNEAPQGPLITSVSVLSGKPYTLGTFATGELLYIDRNYTVQANHSAILDGQEYIRTANNDKNGTSANYLTMELSAPAIVYVLYDHRATVLPAWLDDNTWTLDSGVVETTDVDRVLYFKNFPAGTVELGGNANSPMSGAKSMYSVVVIGQGG